MSLNTGEELERACKCHEFSSNSRKHVELNKPQGRALKHQIIPPFKLDSLNILIYVNLVFWNIRILYISDLFLSLSMLSAKCSCVTSLLC